MVVTNISHAGPVLSQESYPTIPAEFICPISKEIVARHQQHIENEILTRKCPVCALVVLDWDGCVMVECRGDGPNATQGPGAPPHYFCGWCMEQLEGDNLQRHGRARFCSVAPYCVQGQLWPDALYPEILDRTITARLAEKAGKYINELTDTVVRATLIAKMRKTLDAHYKGWEQFVQYERREWGRGSLGGAGPSGAGGGLERRVGRPHTQGGEEGAQLMLLNLQREPHLKSCLIMQVVCWRVVLRLRRTTSCLCPAHYLRPHSAHHHRHPRQAPLSPPLCRDPQHRGPGCLERPWRCRGCRGPLPPPSMSVLQPSPHSGLTPCLSPLRGCSWAQFRPSPPPSPPPPHDRFPDPEQQQRPPPTPPAGSIFRLSACPPRFAAHPHRSVEQRKK